MKFYSCLVTLFYLGLCAHLSAASDPHPARFSEEIGRLLATERNEPPPKRGVLGVGSSSMRLWGPRMASDLAPLTIVPRGFGGSHFSDLNHFFDVLVRRHDPRAIIVYEGDNDLASGKTTTAVLIDFLEFSEQVTTLETPPRVYVLAVKPSPKRMTVWPDALVFNRRLAALCAEMEGYTFVDVATPLLDRGGEPELSLFVEDGIHLNDDGYDLWAEAVRSVVVPAESGYEVKVAEVP